MEDLGQYKEDGDSGDEEEEDRVQFEPAYSRPTWQLLRSLLERPSLGELVKELDFFSCEVFSEGCTDGYHTAVATTPNLAVSTFLRLTPNARKVRLHSTSARLTEVLPTLSRYRNIKSLSIGELREEEFDHVAGSLGHLRHLEAPCFGVTTPFGRSRKYPTGFETLSFRYGDGRLSLPFLVANSSSLRSLTLSVTASLDIAYSDFPQLSSLTLCAGSGRLDPGVQQREINSSHRKFWESLCKSPSLVTLSLESHMSSLSPNDHFTSIFCGSTLWPEKSIPTLRTIRFREDAALDRIRFLLLSPLAKTLHRIILPATWTRQEPNEASMKTRAVVGMCEGSGIEVFYGDDHS
ncbi:hypothetical protein JCM16303_004077 [Sporobolomyces ruberrimus]